MVANKMFEVKQMFEAKIVEAKVTLQRTFSEVCLSGTIVCHFIPKYIS